MKTRLIVIDPQMDFCDHPAKTGSLAVPGAHADLVRLTAMVSSMGSRLDDIQITLDSHHAMDIAHPGWWRDQTGASPAPFTVIKADDVRGGRWFPRKPSWTARTLEYLDALQSGARYDLVVWPEHCLIGTPGHAVHPELMDAVLRWERANLAVAGKVTKGSNPWTEHYSAVRAEVPDPEDPSTQLNRALINHLEAADVVLIAGQALSHCVANTVRDIAAEFDQASVSKLVLLEDASSNVPGFEAFGETFVREMTAKGMRIARTTDFGLSKSPRRAVV